MIGKSQNGWNDATLRWHIETYTLSHRRRIVIFVWPIRIGAEAEMRRRVSMWKCRRFVNSDFPSGQFRYGYLLALTYTRERERTCLSAYRRRRNFRFRCAGVHYLFINILSVNSIPVHHKRPNKRLVLAISLCATSFSLFHFTLFFARPPSLTLFTLTTATTNQRFTLLLAWQRVSCVACVRLLSIHM